MQVGLQAQLSCYLLHKESESLITYAGKFLSHVFLSFAYRTHLLTLCCFILDVLYKVKRKKKDFHTKLFFFFF